MRTRLTKIFASVITQDDVKFRIISYGLTINKKPDYEDPLLYWCQAGSGQQVSPCTGPVLPDWIIVGSQTQSSATFWFNTPCYLGGHVC